MLLRIINRPVCLLCNSQVVRAHEKIVLKNYRRKNFSNPTNICHLHYGAKLMEELPDTSKSNPSKPSAQEPVGKRFKWENRTRTATAMMVLWCIGILCIVIVQNLNKNEKRHKLMLDQSLDWMSNDEKKKMQSMLKDSAFNNLSEKNDSD